MRYINDKILPLTPRGITVRSILRSKIDGTPSLVTIELSQTGSFSSGRLFLNAYNTHMGYLTRNRPAQLRRVGSACQMKYLQAEYNTITESKSI